MNALAFSEHVVDGPLSSGPALRFARFLERPEITGPPVLNLLHSLPHSLPPLRTYTYNNNITQTCLSFPISIYSSVSFRPYLLINNIHSHSFSSRLCSLFLVHPSSKELLVFLASVIHLWEWKCPPSCPPVPSPVYHATPSPSTTTTFRGIFDRHTVRFNTTHGRCSIFYHTTHGVPRPTDVSHRVALSTCAKRFLSTRSFFVCA